MITVDKESFSSQLSVCESVSTSYTAVGKLHTLRPLHTYVEMKIEEDQRIKMSVMRDTVGGYFYYSPKKMEGEQLGKKIIVQTSEIKKLVGSRYEGDITLDSDGENLKITQGSFTAKLPLYRQEEFPGFDFDTEWGDMSLDTLKILSSCMSVSDATAVLIDVHSDGTNLFSYTPTQMVFSCVEGMVGTHGRKVLSVREIKTMIDCFQEASELKFGFKDDRLFVKSSNGSVMFRLLYDEMPLNYTDNLSMEGATIIKINREAFLFVMESISQILAKWDQLILVTVMGSKGQMNLKTKNLMTNAEANETLKVETDLATDFQIGFPSDAVMKYLRAIDDELVEIGVTASDRPLYMTGSEKLFYAVFQPFRI